GGPERIIVSQLADRGTVKVYSGASALDGGPAMYLLNPASHDHGADLREVASFTPFEGGGGARVAATSTTTGAHLLVSGVAGGTARVEKYDFVRPSAQARTLQAVRIGDVSAAQGTKPAILGGE